MKTKSTIVGDLLRTVLLLAVFCDYGAHAQLFGPRGPGDMVATFRKTGTYQGNYEMVVGVGNITNFLSMAQGSVTNISTYSPANLLTAFPDGYADLQWGVFATFSGSASWGTSLGAFPQATLWYTLATPDANSTTNAPLRESVQAQGPMRQNMLALENGANAVSAQNATNQSIPATFVIELASDSLNNVTAFIGDKSNPSLGDFYGVSYPGTSFEGIAPNNFVAPNRCDFFQDCPSSTRFGGTNIDPITGQTNGSPYRVGFFLLKPDGTMTFTRQSTNSVVTPPPPPPPVLSAVVTGTTLTISFATTTNATYTLYHTNAAGLSTGVSAWPVSGTLTGDGTVKSFTDTLSDADRFYRVGAH